MRDLELRGTYTCSTVHTDRRDYPAELKHAKLVQVSSYIELLYSRVSFPKEVQVFALVLLKLVHHQWLYFRESWKKVQSQLAFQHELARLLIACYDGYKHPSTSGKCVIQTLSSKENLKGYFHEKLQGRKKACAMCSKDGKKMQWRTHLQNLIQLQTRWHCLMSANVWRTLLLFEMAWKKLTIKNK